MRIFVILLFTCLSTLSLGQNTPCNCCTENYRQFDFWIGDWVVKDSSGTTILGHNTITMIEDSCGLQEKWTGAQGTTGRSLSFYNRNTKSWHQTWVDSNGGSILMDGQFENGSIVMYTEKRYVERRKAYIQNKTTWTPLKRWSCAPCLGTISR